MISNNFWRENKYETFFHEHMLHLLSYIRAKGKL